jgi:hypothetical protein
MGEWTMEFYTELYRAELILCVLRFCLKNSLSSLWYRDEMEIPLLSHELAEAVTQMSPRAMHRGLSVI